MKRRKAAALLLSMALISGMTLRFALAASAEESIPEEDSLDIIQESGSWEQQTGETFAEEPAIEEPPVEEQYIEEPPVALPAVEEQYTGEQPSQLPSPEEEPTAEPAEESPEEPPEEPAEESPEEEPAEEPPEEPHCQLWLSLMECGSLDQLTYLLWISPPGELEAMSEQELEQLEEQIAYLESLESYDTPTVEWEEPAEGEVIYPSADCPWAAPFGAAVEGPVRRLKAAKARGAEGDSGMVLDKTAQANPDGSVTIELEAFATGSKVISEISRDVPTDIVLVLDQSGSMGDPFGAVTDDSYVCCGLRSNSENYADGGLWYPLPDGGYGLVAVTKSQLTEYEPIPPDTVNYNGGSGDYYSQRSRLWQKVDGEYERVTLQWSNRNRSYTYTFADGSTVISYGAESSPDFGDRGPLYSSQTGDYIYRYTCTVGESLLELGTSIGDNTVMELELFHLYEEGASITRLEALKSALWSFASQVESKAAGADAVQGTADDIDHRVAVLGFARGNQNSGTRYYNTELFIGGSQYRYDQGAQSMYPEAFQPMNTPEGRGAVSAAIGALDAYGSTFTNLGVDMAAGVLDANPVPAGESRNRVVIVFTDGVPGISGFDYDIAYSAIDRGDYCKSGCGATVYTVGVFQGADASSSGDPYGSDSQRANWFMQQLSSNNGAAQLPGYYLSAADADTLTGIFQQISQYIETGGSATTLSGETVIRDIIAPAFTLPEGADESSVTVETYSCTGEDSWVKNTDSMGAAVTVSDGQLAVSGFDFADNYVGTVTEGESVSYRGSKLVIRFDVIPRPGFLGGNNVMTNSAAGVYADAAAQEPLLLFPRPAVNVPIPDIELSVTDKNVYLLGSLTAAQLMENASVAVGGAVIDLSRQSENYGLEPWQSEYVDISVRLLDGGVDLAGYEALTEDEGFSLSLTVSPKETALSASSGDAAQEKTGYSDGKVSVFLPILSFIDSRVWYGDSLPLDYTGNLKQTRWVHGETVDTDTVMSGAAPELRLSFTPEPDKTQGGLVACKENIGVDVQVFADEAEVTAYADFRHIPCEGAECALPEGSRFLLHVNTCSLTLRKLGGNANEPYVFSILRDGAPYTEASVPGGGSVTLYELPTGCYTAAEDEGWSWRYGADDGGAVQLSGASPTGEISCLNTGNGRIYWLNGYSGVAANVRGLEGGE